ncbi:MAG: F0F1 ATP synthase subunit epsilon [Planctomycetes bacterium]|nr:F0F1 ATP synthase subunit epsilon [Planctomycetota bacterium]
MRLRILLPTRVLMDEEVEAVVAEGVDGEFGLLPRHQDLVACLAPGILSYRARGAERFVAVHGGVLVKAGDVVDVSTRDAVAGDDPAALERAVQERFAAADANDRAARSAVEKLEFATIRRLVEFQRGR